MLEASVKKEKNIQKRPYIGKKENFLLAADIQIEQWTFSNGQDGFGLMASDTIGINGDETTLWNNSYMASVTKVGYFYDKGYLQW